MAVLTGLEPQRVFHYFEEIAAIPHGSTNTKAISDYCVAFATAHNLRYAQDDLNNVIIYKDGTAGYENSAPVIIQGHLDMVCEKDADCDIDFEKDGLRLQVENGIVSAKGTTLGGDDGIAIAYALAILEAEDIPHPPLEVVFTVDEEIGMFGAVDLDYSLLKGRTMLNIDSEEEGYLLVSCAGGITAAGHLPLARESYGGTATTLKVDGLLGGHSGVEIDKGRANSNHVMGRILFELSKEVEFRLTSVTGGLKDNAIPRCTEATIILGTAKTDAFSLDTFVSKWNDILKKEYQTTDADIALSIVNKTEATTSHEAFTAECTKNVISALYLSPTGIIGMSHDIEGLVQTSLNLGIVKMTDDELICSFAVRSSVATEKEELVARLTCLFEGLSGYVTTSGDYPAWEYRQDSPLRDLMVQIYKEQTGKEPVIQALHAGLECGLFAGGLPGLDCISFGPDMKDIHTPSERMYVDSVERTWVFIKEILKRLQ